MLTYAASKADSVLRRPWQAPRASWEHCTLRNSSRDHPAFLFFLGMFRCMRVVLAMTIHRQEDQKLRDCLSSVGTFRPA